ncbi:uncharacterized protein KZ484_023856 isoform 2-T3 [Pholidichthys leucotaenia]
MLHLWKRIHSEWKPQNAHESSQSYEKASSSTPLVQRVTRPPSPAAFTTDSESVSDRSTVVSSEADETTDEDGDKDDSEGKDYTPPLRVLADFSDDIQSICTKKSIAQQSSEVENNEVQGERSKLNSNHSGSQALCRPKRTYNCLTCGKEFPRGTSLKRHLVIHSGERPFKCFICGRGFTQSGNLKTHMKVHKGEMHKWALVQEKSRPKEPPPTIHVCRECGMDFPEKQQLEEHREIHKKPYSCPDCGKTFKHEKSVEIHMRLHSVDCPFICSVCGKRCTSAETLTAHMLTHTGEKNFHCDQCGKAFSQSSRLKLHLRTHTGERPYLCSVCGKSYAKRQAFTTHLRVHSGEKAYRCDKCGKCYYYIAGYHEHLKSHDKKPKTLRPLGRPKQQPVVEEDL